jgi:capsular polysaccharide transport system permease protein
MEARRRKFLPMFLERCMSFSIATQSRPSFLASLRLQFRVIIALLIREGQAHYTQRSLGFFWTIADPLILTCGVIVLWTVTGRGEHPGLNLVAFALTAYTHIQLWRLCVLPALTLLHHNLWLFYHQNIQAVDIVIANCVMKSISIFTSFVIVVSVCMLFGVIKPIADPGLVLAAWCMDTLFCFSFAVFIAGFAALSEMIEKIMHPLMYLTLPISGAFTMTYFLPPGAKAIMIWMPLANCVEMFRAGVIPLDHKTYWSVPLIVLSSLALLAIGLPVLEYARRKADITG